MKITRTDRWWATFNAAVAGHWANDDYVLAEIVSIAADLADEAHTAPREQALELFEKIREVIDTSESLSLDDQDDRLMLLKRLGALIGVE